jgi:hypothetical protein
MKSALFGKHASRYIPGNREKSGRKINTLHRASNKYPLGNAAERKYVFGKPEPS